LKLCGAAGEVASEDDLEKSLERRLAAVMGKERQWMSEEQVCVCMLRVW
jgi:hypothetical protein